MTQGTGCVQGEVTLAERTNAAKAMSHPLRAQLLALLADRVASPNELAAELKQPLTNVSYHVRQLAELHMIEQVDAQPRRGALEHYYTAVYTAEVSVTRVGGSAA